MKIIEKKNVKKRKIKKNHATKPKKEHVLVVAQEIKFARLLAGNEQKTRDRALKSLKKWLLNCFQKEYEFKEEDFTRIWKGLFYAVWMSDKPLVQEELCDSIASLLDLFPEDQLTSAVLLTRVGLAVLAQQWYGLDTHRIDKFLMLVRRYLRASLRVLHRALWTPIACEHYASMLSDGPLALKTPLYARNATSLLTHVLDCFLEELAKVSEGEISPTSLSILLRPFVSYMCNGENHTVATSCRRLLNSLVRQSDLGLEYQERTRAWERMGCPEGGPEALELEVDSDGDAHEEEPEPSERALDPRAGRVDVELPTLPVPCEQIVAMLKDMLNSLGSKAHKRARICLKRFEQLSLNQYPLPVQTGPLEVATFKAPTTALATKLQALEKSLVEKSDELALRGLSRKHRKRLLAQSRAGISIVDQVSSANKVNTNGDWQIENTEPLAKKTKKESNKENHNKKRLRKRDKQNGEANNQKHDKVAKTDKALKKDKILKKQNATNVVNSDTKITNAKGDSKKSVTKMSKVIKSDTKINKDSKPKNSLADMKEKLDKRNSNIDNKKVSPKNISKSVEKSTVVAKKVKVFQKQLSPNQTKQKTSPKSVKVDLPTPKKLKNFQKQLSTSSKKQKQSPKSETVDLSTPKKVKFVLKNNSMQGAIDYYKSVRQSPSIPFDSSKKPTKTNLKVSTPSPINPFFKKKMKLKNRSSM